MARRNRTQGSDGTPVTVFHHGDGRRLNIPDATETQPGLSKGKKRIYRYNPHLSPKLQFDPTGDADQVPQIIEKVLAGQKPTPDEAEILRAVGQQGAQPWLEWAAKQEQHARGTFAVDDVVLHIHERISAQAILATARREELGEQDFFARPHLHREQALQYYRHSVDWSNRLILGDSLQVMSSLSNRENLAGQVQMIYFDPPYGISFKSNWQNEIYNRSVGESEEDITREPEVIKAYRDTWTLGVHSYLAYLKQRFVIMRELLKDTGSLFVQISDDNAHRVRALLDEVFEPVNFVASIVLKKSSPESKRIKKTFNYLLWVAKNKKNVTVRKVYRQRSPNEGSTEDPKKLALWVKLPTGETRTMSTDEKRDPKLLPEQSAVFRIQDIETPGVDGNKESVVYRGRPFQPKVGKCWRGKPEEMQRLLQAERISETDEGLGYRFFLLKDSPVVEYTSLWDDTAGNIPDMRYVVQTNTKVVERCLLMTTEPGDLVDPTCGSGTTAYAAEEWGRRWITIDSSRVAVSIARERLLTACFESYKTKDPAAGVDPTAPQNPAYGFNYHTFPHITLKSIAQNQNLDPIFAKHDSIVASALADLNAALAEIGPEATSIHVRLVDKLKAKVATAGGRGISGADLRCWLLPGTDANLIAFGTANQRAKWRQAIPEGLAWREWEVPFDSDPDWPQRLQDALMSYRAAWRAKSDEVNAAITANADPGELVDQPQAVRGVSRVSGPFSIEGVRPEELTLGEDGKIYDATADSVDDAGVANADAYVDLMISLLRNDGVTFLGNRHAEFASLEKEAGKSFHARGCWKGKEGETVAVVFGPQYGPINAPLAVEAIDAARGLKEITELVLAGFSFDAAAQEKAKQMDSPTLRIHIAHIRPDVSPGMQGLLKETPNNQLFTVFGQPDIRVVPAGDSESKVEMNGVCIYNPLTGEISESSNKKVAAWFLDTDYDGRCFCTSQAFFPDKTAWTKIAKTLGLTGEHGFQDFTISWPFKPGKHKRIAVKVIDPRGNEVIAIQTLNT